MKFLLALSLFIASTAPAAVKDATIINRACWTIDAGALRVSVLQAGGHIAEITLKGAGEVNPLWIQNRATIDADRYDPAKHEKTYGPGSGARLMSGLAGHNLCFPYWGNPSPTEAAAGMTFHGEAGVVRWRKQSAETDGFTLQADFPESRTRMTRSLTVKGQVVYVNSLAENLSAWDRPIGWCEHVTVGPPFLEKGKTQFQATLTRGRADHDRSGKSFAWPNGMAEKPVDLRVVRDVPQSGFVNNFLVDPSKSLAWFAIWSPSKNLVFGYVFPRQQFPWLNIWEANNAEMLTRGFEFSGTSTHGTAKEMAREPELWGVPAHEFLDARGKLRKRFAAFSVRVPASFQGVGDVVITSTELRVIEKNTAKPAAIAFDRAMVD